MHDDSGMAIDAVEATKRRGGSVYLLRGVHLWTGIIVLIATTLLAIGIAWGRQQSQIDQERRDIDDMKAEKYVPKDEYWRDMDELRRSIEQLSGKIDALNHLIK